MIERDSRCCRPPLGTFVSQRSLPWGSRDEEKDMKRTPTTPRSPPGNPGDKTRPLGVGSGHSDPLSASSIASYTARGPHIQSMGGGSRTNSGSSLSSMSSSSSSTSRSSVSSELGGLPQQRGARMVQYGVYDNRMGMNAGYGKPRVTANPSNQRLGYHYPPSVMGGQSTLRYGDSGLRTGYRDQQALVHDTEMGYGFGPGSKYRSRVQSTGSMGKYSPPSSSHYHTPGGYASLGDRLTGPYSNTQSYSQPYEPPMGAYQHYYASDSSYTQQYPHASNYSTSQYAHHPAVEPHNADEYDPYRIPYDYKYTEPQPMSLSASQNQNYEEHMISELSGQPIEHLTSEFNSKLTLEQSAKKHTQSQSDVDDRLQITEHPKDTKVVLKQVATLSCKAHVLDSKEEPNFLWYKDREPLIGEINSDYVVEEATEKDEGVYYCLVSHPQEDELQKTSNSAQLTVRTGKG